MNHAELLGILESGFAGLPPRKKYSMAKEGVAKRKKKSSTRSIPSGLNNFIDFIID